MAHELEIFADGRASFAHAFGTAPGWHSLGQMAPEGADGRGMAEAANILWPVVMERLGFVRSDLNPAALAGFRAITRGDTGTVFGIATDKYKPVQNLELCTFFDAFARLNGLKIETVGTVKGGSRVWALARAPSLVAEIGKGSGDEVRAYLLLAAGHDGTFGVRGKLTKIRVVCANTWAASGIGGNGDAFKMSHLQDFDDDMKRVAAEAMGLQVEDFRASVEVANALAARRCSDEDAESFFRRLLSMAIEAPAAVAGPAPLLAAIEAAPAVVVPDAGLQRAAAAGSLLDSILGVAPLPGFALESAGLSVEGAAAAAEFSAAQSRAKAEPSSRTLRQLMAAREESPGAELSSARGSWWGTVNAVTWESDNFGSNRDSRMNSAWFGGGNARKGKAFELALEMSGATTGPAMAAAA